MRRSRTVMTNFAIGEVAPEFFARLETEQYSVALKRLENAYCRMQGGISKMPGTLYLGDAYSEGAGNPVRLASFVYDSDDAYVLEFGELYLRIWDKDGTVHQTIDTNCWSAKDVHRLQIAGSDRFRFMAHAGYAPRKLDFNVSTKVFELTIPTFTNTTGGANFGDAGDCPGAVSFYEERLVFGGTINEPMTMWASEVGVFTNFLPPDPITAASPWQHTLSHGAADDARILWIDAYGVLLAGSSTTEYSIRGTSDVGLTATSFLIRRESAYGSDPVQSKLVDDNLIFAQRYGKRIRSYAYRDINSPYIGEELNFVANHITKPGIVQIDHSQDPLGITWFVRKDGVLVGMTSERGMEAYAWHKHTTNGRYESVAVIPGVEHDEIWVAVARDINGATTRYIERFDTMEYQDQADGVFTHSAIVVGGEDPVSVSAMDFADPLTATVSSATGFTVGDFVRIRAPESDVDILGGGEYEITAITGEVLTLGTTDGGGAIDASGWTGTFSGPAVAMRVYDAVSGLGHLEGETVAVLADGGRHAEKEVDSGAIALDRWTEKAIIGLPYRAIAESLPGMFGVFQQSVRASVRFHHTVGCLAGDKEGDLREMLWKTQDDDYVGPAPLFTGDKRDFFPGFTKMDQGFTIANDYPLPWTVLGIIVETTVSPED